MTKKRKNFKKSTTLRTYRPLTGIARKAGIPKYRMEAALIEGLAKLSSLVWTLADVQQFDETGMAADALSDLEAWLSDNHDFLAPVVNEILQQRLKQPVTHWDTFQLLWEQHFSTFPIELKPTYNVALKSKPEPPADAPERPW